MNQNQRDIEEHLLLKYLTGEADDPIRREVEAWLEADAGNRVILDRLESLWLETGRLDPPPLAVDTDAAWNRITVRMETFGGQAGSATQKHNPRIIRFSMVAAAAMLLLFGTWFVLKLILGPPEMVEMAASTAVLRDTLPDGSQITLNAGSKLTYPEKFKGEIREVKLTGEAFFEVKRDSHRPFVVDAGPARVKVLGTSFRMKSLQGKPVEVHVTSGRVMLFRVDPRTSDTASIILEAGEHGILRIDAAAPELVEQSAPDDLFWANRTLEFVGTPLQQVIPMLERYFDIEIRVSNPQILNCRLAATFLDDPPDRILTVIAESFGLTLETSGRNYMLTGDGCGNEAR